MVAAGVVAGVAILSSTMGAAAWSGTASADGTSTLFQQGGAPGEPIPLTPISGLTSLEAAVTITADGLVAGEPTTGDLTARLASNQEGMSRIDVTGSLLGDVVAQVGGRAVSLFRPEQLSIYDVPEGSFVMLTGLLDVCVRLTDPVTTQALDQLSPGSLMTILTSSDVARGTLAGEETLDGTAVRHYVIDGDAFLAAAQGSSDPNVSGFATSLLTASDADLYVSVDGGYPVAYRGGFGGAFEPLKFAGELDVAVDVTGINTAVTVTLPEACSRPISL